MHHPHPLSAGAAPMSAATWQVLRELFARIGWFWRLPGDIAVLQSRLQSFVQNRIEFDPLYAPIYEQAAQTLVALIAELGAEAAYEKLFTDASANQAPPTTPLALARQKVANEFVALYLALGGFKAFGALNYPGYFGGANGPGAPAPYRTAQP